MEFPRHIFRSYDIRGLVEGELSVDLAYRIGRAFVGLLAEEGTDFTGRAIVVGEDMRETSPEFAEQIVQAITDSGVDVVRIGQVSTPLFGFSVASSNKFVGGVMITASHNPSEYNGFKFSRAGGRPVGLESGLDVVRDLAEAGEYTQVQEQQGSVREERMQEAYYKKLFSLVPKESIKPLKLVIDAGNGMAEATFPELLKQLPVEVEYLYLTPDGNFPNHEANPLKTETLAELQNKVRENNADLGFALDGDCDRIGLVDEQGEVVEPSFVGALLGLEMLKLNPGMHMLYDLRSSKIVPEMWEANGATTAKCKVGHANIKKQMREEKAGFASELSLHLYFESMNYLESSDLCLLLFLKLLSESGKPLSELIAPLKKYHHSGEMNFEVEDKDGAIERLQSAFADSAENTFELDGVSFEFSWGWFNIRKSNTESVLRLNVEAWDSETMKRKRKEVTDVIEGNV